MSFSLRTLFMAIGGLVYLSFLNKTTSVYFELKCIHKITEKFK